MDEICNEALKELAPAIRLFHGKWKIHILCILCTGPVRIGQLRRLLPGSTNKVLRQSLRELEQAGLVQRIDLSQVILHVEYALLDNAQEQVCELVRYLRSWAIAHTSDNNT